MHCCPFGQSWSVEQSCPPPPPPPPRQRAAQRVCGMPPRVLKQQTSLFGQFELWVQLRVTSPEHCPLGPHDSIGGLPGPVSDTQHSCAVGSHDCMPHEIAVTPPLLPLQLLPLTPPLLLPLTPPLLPLPPPLLLAPLLPEPEPLSLPLPLPLLLTPPSVVPLV
jgi:hypothetical protein